MSDQNSVLKSVENLLNRADKFSQLATGQQAAFRAQLTRTLKELETLDGEDELKAILQDLQDEIGAPESPSAKKLTGADIVDEYAKKYTGYSMRQRAAFKAKMQRLINEGKTKEDQETVDTLTDLQDEMAATEIRLRRQRVLALARGRGKVEVK